MILIILAFLTGYYAHYHSPQRFPPVMKSDGKTSVEQDYHLSDMQETAHTGEADGRRT
ncbi:hypothetical protein [Buttiauxella sp.]|uniref:hypothetical protein n=1 Tax=Buttiauxella sp. TaxID=1972222 RepID=UPI003C764B5A